MFEGLTILFALLFAISAFYVVRFGLLILKFQDSIGQALDIIDEKYSTITEICDRPLFYDSPEVRRVLEDLKETRLALHKVAYSLTTNMVSEEE